MSTHDEVVRAVAAAHRDEWRRVMAATVRTTRDLDLAEESVQDAYEAALVQWETEGVPRNPGAWLTTTAKRRALDTIRRAATLRSKLPLLVYPDSRPEPYTSRPEPVEGPTT
ncbi:sigma factor, partial [Escherichia coli]|uniref:sigma factor n=1 Tax=Escherichia coli TaxID=562 RepID=UPI00215800CE